MLEGWLARGLDPSKSRCSSRSRRRRCKALARRGVAAQSQGQAGGRGAIVIAVKPQSAPEALPALARYVGKATLVLSIMAGRTLGFLQGHLPRRRDRARHAEHARRHRPRHHGRGRQRASVSAPAQAGAPICSPPSARSNGSSDEALMDAVTAVSGSGPAYVFLLAEAMTKAGIAAGLPARARRAAGARNRRRLRRAAASLDARCRDLAPERHLARRHHRRGAGSADGTRRLRRAADQAIAAATRRGRELAG